MVLNNKSRLAHACGGGSVLAADPVSDISQAAMNVMMIFKQRAYLHFPKLNNLGLT